MKSPLFKIIACAVLSICAQKASADIKQVFRKGEQVTIGDSIKGRMLRFSTDGVLHTMDPNGSDLPSECRIVLQENDTVWFENMFHIQSENNYHHWLQGLYIKDASFTNPQTSKEETHDIFAIIPFVDIDYMEWRDGDNRVSCDLTLCQVLGGNPPDIRSASKHQWPTDEQKMDSYIKFIIGEDMSLDGINSFGEMRTNYTTDFNYYYTCPYGINLNKLAHKNNVGGDGGIVYISNLKLKPILPSEK